MKFLPALISRIKRLFSDVYSQYKNEYEERENNTRNTTSPKKRNLSNIESIPEHVHLVSFLDVQSAEDEEETEILSCLESEREKRAIEVEYFYRSGKQTYPVLYAMVKDFLAIPAMSAPSEALFSRIGDVVTKKRNRLLANLTKMLAFLKYRGKLVGNRKIFGDEELDEELDDNLDDNLDEDLDDEFGQYLDEWDMERLSNTDNSKASVQDLV